MEHVLIYYNNDSLLYLINELKKIYNFKRYCILKCGERANEVEYNSLEIIDNYTEIPKGLFDTAFIISEAPFVNRMYYELYELGIKKVYTLNVEYLSLLKENENISKLITEFDLTEKPLIGYLETHLYNQCNLNCKGCTHFSNIDETPFMTLEEYEKNITRLSELYNINTFRLMGGEPLLNKNLKDYIEVTRKHLKNSNIDIVTNGLLLCGMDKELIDTIKKNNITLKISLYIPIEKIKDKIEEFLNKNNISHFYGNGCKQADDNLLIRDFHKCLTLEKNHDAVYNVHNCFARECWFLKDHYIAMCATPMQVHLLNEKFGTNFEVTDKDYIDIFDSKTGTWKDVKKLLDPNDFCKYCSEVEYKYNWDVKTNNQELSDYVVIGGK